jgi:hypothetical protein
MREGDDMQGEVASRRLIRALRVQILGLAILLSAMAWQTFFSDWFDKSATEWQYFIQSEVNSASALAMQRVAGAMAASAPAARTEELQTTANDALLALSRIALERDLQRARSERRALAVKYGRFALFAIGALVLIAGLIMAIPRRSDA